MLKNALLALLVFAPSIAGQDSNWPQFRGPGGLALADDSPIPASFGPDENVLWKTSVPRGHASPCIMGERIFVAGFDEGRNVVVALDRATGAKLWSKSFEGPPARDFFHPDATPALTTPVADEERVIAYLGNYGLVAFDHDGKVLWEKRLTPPANGFGVGASPLLYDGLVIISRDGAEEAGILALDAADGSQVWLADRFEFSEAHGTPFLWRNADRDEVVVPGARKLCSYAPTTGKLLWSVSGLTSLPCTTPTADEDTLYFAAWSTMNASGRSFWEGAFARALDLSDAEVEDPALLFARLDKNGDGKIPLDELPECRAKDSFGFLDGDQSGAWEVEEFAAASDMGQIPGANLMVAVKRGASGDAGETHVRWSWKRGLPYVASPLLYRGRVWLFKSGGLVTCLDAGTGEPVFSRTRLGDRSEYYTSPVGAAGHVITASAEGTLVVLDAAADELVVQYEVALDEPLFSTPAVLDGKLFVRTESTLWAFGEASAE